MSKNINDEVETLDTTKLKTSDYQSLEHLLKEYITSIKNNHPDIAVIGVPGPVQDNTIMKLPNVPHWKSEDGENLGQVLNIKKFLFINDFACNSYGVQTKLILNEDYIVINEGEPKEHGAKAIIGPGTGLGMGYLIKNKKDKYYTVGNSEGGHQNFSRKNRQFYELAEFVKKEYDLQYVTIENICSGQGMVPIYKFLLQKEKEENELGNIDREPTLAQKVDNFFDYSNKKVRDELSNEITLKGVKGECKLSRKVIELFVEILADAASDLSLTILPTNGIYLLGGISVNIEPFIKENNLFMEHFLDKDHRFLLKSFPVYLIKNSNIGMIGASEAARRLIEEQEDENN